MRFNYLAAFLTTSMLFSCGQKPASESHLNKRHDTPANHVSAADVQSLLTHVKEIATSSSQTGKVSVSEFVKVMPMIDDERSIIVSAYPGFFAVSCELGLCSASATGNATQAQMDVEIPGLPANPALTLASAVSANFVMRGDSAVEFCNIEGMNAKKLFIKLKIQGLHLALQNGAPYLNVNIGSDSENYTCD